MRTDKSELGGSELPIILSIGGTPIGGACAICEEQTGTWRFEGLDVIARVFFAEYLGPGGPGDDTRVQDVCVLDHVRHRTLRAPVATVRHFSAGAGELELTAAFDQDPH
jgi:hypothetical protein